MQSTAAIDILQKKLKEMQVIRDEKAKELDTMDEEIREFREAISILVERASGVVHQPFLEVRKRGVTNRETIQQAISRIIRNNKRFMHINEIADILSKEEGRENSDADSLSRALTSYKYHNKDNNLATVTKGLRANTFHGFKEWLTDAGQPKTEYMYDTSQFKYSTKKEDATLNTILFLTKPADKQ